MDEIEAAAPQMRQSEIRDYLARFLFSGDDVFKTVALLSGGERGRLALAILGLQGANLLLLDEPRNHLDLSSQEILQTMLAEFNGTILLVSHDRYLIDELATQVWEVLADESRLGVFEGTYSEYKAYRLSESQKKINDSACKVDVKLANQRSKTSIHDDKPGGISKNERLRLQKKLENVENEIADLELRMKELEQQLQNPPEDGLEVGQLGADYQNTQHELTEQLNIWEEIATRLEDD